MVGLQTYSATLMIIHAVHSARAAAMTLRTVLLSIQALLQVFTKRNVCNCYVVGVRDVWHLVL